MQIYLVYVKITYPEHIIPFVCKDHFKSFFYAIRFAAFVLTIYINIQKLRN